MFVIDFFWMNVFLTIITYCFSIKYSHLQKKNVLGYAALHIGRNKKRKLKTLKHDSSIQVDATTAL